MEKAKKKLLTTCKYFNGDHNKGPEGGDALICWIAESTWVDLMVTDKEFDFGLLDYIQANLREYMAYDGIPITLKSILFSYYCKLSEHINVENFKEFYEANY